MNRCLVTFLRGGKVDVVIPLMKYHCKVKGEQVMVLQMAQQLKTKIINVLVAQLFCRQCKATFLLETNSLH